jgi:hypothetical protein
MGRVPFGKVMSKMMGQTGATKLERNTPIGEHMTKDGALVTLQPGGGKRKGYCLGSLLQARERFQQATGLTVPWDEEAREEGEGAARSQPAMLFEEQSKADEESPLWQRPGSRARSGSRQRSRLRCKRRRTDV